MSQNNVEFSKFGQTIFFKNIYNNDYILNSIIRTNNFYETDLLDWLCLLNIEDGVFIDVGANIGNHTIFFSKVMNREVWSFEPNKKLFDILNSNIELNQLDFNKTFNLALGDKNTKCTLSLVDDLNMGTGFVREDDAGDIELMTLDQVFVEDIHISLIKIDVEGYELNVLEGALNTLKKSKPLILIECQNEFIMGETITFLDEFNYVPISIFGVTPMLIFSHIDKKNSTFSGNAPIFFEEYQNYKKNILSVKAYRNSFNIIGNELKETKKQYEEFKKEHTVLINELEDYKGSRLKYKRLYEASESNFKNSSKLYETIQVENKIMKKNLEDYQGSHLKYKRLYEKTLKELHDYKGSRLKYKRLYEKTLKELHDYKGSRLKYKKQASYFEYKYNKITSSFLYKAYKNTKKILRVPYQKVLIKIKKDKSVALNQKNCQRKDFFQMSKLQGLIKEDIAQPTTIIYADLNMNIVDGSSIWLSSVTNLFSSFSNVIILSKHNIKTNLIISNLKKSDFQQIVIEPKDFNMEDGLSLDSISKALIYIDELVPSVQNLVVRGVDGIEEVIKNNHFKGRLIPYLTNFYTQTTQGTQINKDKIILLEAISHQTKLWLWQTEEMRKTIEKNVILYNKNYLLFPPILETKDFQFNKKERIIGDEIIIGYAGKIQPDWGVLELIEETEKLINAGYRIRLKIISSKISHRGTIKSGDGFVEKVKKYLNKDFIEFIENVNRATSIKLLSEVDYIWSYRDKEFEETTLELSTKLLEGVVLEKPLISYPSSIHKQVLGDDYPYYLEKPSDLKKLLFETTNQFDLKNLALSILNEYSSSTRIIQMKALVKEINNKKIVLAGHDFKFIDHFYSDLKNQGFLVCKDYWEWGEADIIERSEFLYNQSDIIFCEWGLANAVWYSNKNITKKPLFIRSHLQEINPKAKKFGPKINLENVEKVIFVSEHVCNTAKQMWRWDDSKTVVIPNYVLTDDFVDSGIKKQKSKIHFGMVGITPQRKRLDRVISLMEDVLKKYPEAKLYIKGERPENYEWMHAPGRVEELDYYYEQYERIEKNELLKNAVIFDGFGNDMPDWYQKIDFILSPSDFESFHYALADGVASGCLPIVWNWEEAKKIYSDKWIVNNEEEAFNKFKEYMMLSDESFSQMKQKNRDLIIKKYGYSNIYKLLFSELELV